MEDKRVGAERAGNERGGVASGENQACGAKVRNVSRMRARSRGLNRDAAPNGAKVDTIESFKLEFRHGMI